ncbi:sialate O-acetylesterase [Coraliomargarita algicola]|uniref:Sialate O-acetylesterase n=1 Tax=Coraliomargarita algicola TaxID=3092156 RepID=A0ABZ0RIR0_9BACT|nr:sialate O-acetylesterase [Coraliomargarita sp. J2-16]WPJ96090.1 sialate O-acetylesterase [Coraliomargarita sp. J2-16]
MNLLTQIAGRNSLDVVRFHPAFMDRMVLQRELPITVRGSSLPQTLVVVTFANLRLETESNVKGQWEVDLPAMPASSESREMRMESAGRIVVLEDVLVGEVWFCSGQSNMEFALKNALEDGSPEYDFDNPSLRLLQVEVNGAEEPLEALYGQRWEVCRAESADEFSAVAFYFGQELQARLQVPVGLIHASLGGTMIESWMSLSSLQGVPSSQANVAEYLGALARSRATRIEGVCQDPPQLETDATDSVGVRLGWAELDTAVADWPQMQLPTQWQQQGFEQNGVFWFRREVRIPEEWRGYDLKVSLGAIDKSDVTYWDGQRIGMTPKSAMSYLQVREYSVPASLVRTDVHVLAVRVRSDFFDGGVTGPAESMYITCPALSESASLPLAGQWHFQVENDYGCRNLKTPTQLFNGMVAPYSSYPVRGVIWYQGESNVGRASEYQQLFPAMIQDWRRAWGREELAFHFVQLPNYLAPTDEPGGKSEWASLRDAQAAALEVSDTGMAVTIDLGEAEDIHPRSKWRVGQRLAWSALAQTYQHQDIPASGPRLLRSTVKGDQVHLRFELFGSSLSVSGESLDGFALAGSDGVYHWANAQVADDIVVLSAPSVRAPVYVRYAWADNPRGTLYNLFGQPAAPFSIRLDGASRSS